MMNEETFPERPRDILILDDDEDFLASLKLLLEAKDFNAHTVQSFEDALEVADRIQPRVALLDYQLGFAFGTDIIPLLIERHPHIQCILVSGYDKTTLAEALDTPGLYTYLPKPVEIETLVELLEELFDR